MGSLPSMLREMGKIAQQKIGVKFDVVDYTYGRTEDVMAKVVSMFKKGDLDFGYMFSQDFLRYAKTGDRTIIPFMSITMYGRPYAEMCVYTRKADNIKDIKTLKGKIWGGMHTLPTRYILYKNGIDKSLPDYFSKMVFISDTNTTAMLDALLEHQTDASVMASFQVGMVRSNNKKYNAIAESSCTEYDHNWIFVHHKDVPKDLVDKIKKTFLMAHKDKDFAQFHFIMKAIQGHFVDIEAKDLKTTVEIVDLATKNGWYKEEDKYINKNSN